MADTPKAAPAQLENAPADIAIQIAESEPNPANKEPLDVKKLELMKDDLKKIVDAMNQGSSYLSQAAKFWSEIPLWQKVAGGLALTVPLFILTALFQSVVLMCINAFAVIAYTTGSFLLDNHTSQNLDRTQNLKQGIDGLADLLIGTISLLDQIGNDLGIETKKFSGENERLATNVDHLGNGVSSLNQETTRLRETQLDIGAVKDGLAAQVESLRLTFVQQKMASDETLAKLSDTQSLYSADQVKFSAELAKLQQLNEKATRDAATLQKCLEAFSSTIGLNEESRKKFDEKLNAMINDSTASFTTVAGQLSEQVNQLKATADGYKDLNGEHGTLIAKQEALIIQAEEFVKLQTEKMAQLDAQLATNAEKDRELERLRAEIQRRDAESERLRASGLALVRGKNNLFGDAAKGKRADHNVNNQAVNGMC